MVTISAKGVESDRSLQSEKCAHCIFEYIYFARLDSRLDGINVYDARIAAGRSLARSHPVAADLVTGVPESGLPAAKGFALESGIPFGFAFYKNSYIGRTFIKPSQAERESGVHLKLSVLAASVKGKRIVLVDDSIVRGTTMKNLVQMLKEAGATEVHVRISSPPFRHPCYFGTDVPSEEELIANRLSLEGICRMLGLSGPESPAGNGKGPPPLHRLFRQQLSHGDTGTETASLLVRGIKPVSTPCHRHLCYNINSKPYKILNRMELPV